MTQADEDSRVEETDEETRVRGPVRRLLGFGNGLYGQVRGALGAFALAAFIGHVFHIGWRGYLLDLIGYWDEYVRPVSKFVTHTLVTTPSGWLGWHYEVPQPARDYLAVGTVLTLSLARSYSRHKRFSWRRVDGMVTTWLMVVITWPVLMGVFLVMMVLLAILTVLAVTDWILGRAAGKRRPFQRPTFSTGRKWERMYRSFVPLLYLALLLVLNAVIR